MVSHPLSNLSAVRKQQLLVEYSSLKSACPHGVFMSLTPGNPTLWSGIIFIRKGPYASSILRFQIDFPNTYPVLPPLVRFSTDIFHPLIAPLTTHIQTNEARDEGAGGGEAMEEERLPPGGFSLRNGFPGWFGRGGRRSAERVGVGSSGAQTPGTGSANIVRIGGVESPISNPNASPTPRRVEAGDSPGNSVTVRGRSNGGPGIFEVLRYVRSTFDDEDVLDRVPLEAAGNPGAWHAWRIHRVKLGKIGPVVEGFKEGGHWDDDEEGGSASISGAPESSQKLPGGASAPLAARRPGEWNWEGVWEDRVKKGVEGSVAEAVLYGNFPGDDLIRFLHMDREEVESVKENIRRSIESGDAQRRGL